MQEVSGQIGSRKIFENDKVIMWYFELAPGEETVMHKHERSYMWYALQGAPLDCTGLGGEDLGVFDVPDNSVFNIRADGDILTVLEGPGAEGIEFPATHKAKNAGNQNYVEILVEFK